MSEFELQAKLNAERSEIPIIWSRSKNDTSSQMTTSEDLGLPVDETPPGFGGQIEDRMSAEERLPFEARLRRSEVYLAEAQRLSHTGSFGWNVSTDEHFWSEETFRVFEFSPSLKVSLPTILQRVHPQDMPSVEMAIAAASRAEGINLEFRLLMPDGRIKYLHVVGKAERDETGSIEVIGAVMDVTARKLTEIDLRRSKAHLADAQRLSRTGSVGMEVSTKRIFWSDEAARIYGYPPGTEPTPELILQRSHPDDVDFLKDVLGRAAQGGTDFDCQHRLLMPDGSIKHLHDLAHCFRDEAGNEEIVGAITDVTERKAAEEAIRRSEAYLTEAQRLSHIGSFGWKPDTGEIIWSDETYRIFEYDRAVTPTVDLVTQRVHSEDRAGVQSVIESVSAGAADFDHTFRLLLPDGRVKHVHTLAHATRDASANREFVGAATDITDRRQAEQRLVAQYRVTKALAESDTLQEVTPKILHAVCEYLAWDLGQLWRTDRARGVLRCVEVWHKESIEATQFVASSRDRTFLPGIGLPGRVWSSREPAYIPDVVEDPNFPRSSKAILAGLHAAFAFPIVLGREVLGVMEFFSREIRQPDQDLLNMMATVGSQIGQFIERKRAEEELRASESKYRHLVDTTPAFIHTSLPNGELDFCSRGMLEYVGLCLTEVLGWGWASLIHPEDAEAIAKWRAALDAGEPFVGELRVRRADGKYRWFLHREEPLRNEAGEIVKWYGSCFEIEERKIAEETIRAQETELRQILDLTPQHVGVFGPNGRPLYVNQVGLEYFGIDMDQWRDQASRLDLVHPDDREQFIEAHNTAVLRGKPHEFESRLLRHDGRFRWFLFRLNPFKDEEGQVRRWYGTGTDIEDRKQAEEEIRKENIALREEIITASMFEEIVGNSPPLQQVLSRVVKVAPTDSTVLITGETGTGKELIARAIHRASQRASRAFVSVNCAAIPQSLIASELFGHEKGAFTGAIQRRLGRFELAEGGTIFLDEVGELPPETQVVLLRMLQEREFERVGGNRSIRVDVRVIVATNRDLQASINAGTFREDLFYRLNVFPIEVPPLRERREDIPLLLQYFIDRYARKVGKNIRSVRKKTLDEFQSYPWPGNIRELQNVIERSVILCETEIFSIDESWLPQQPFPAKPKNQIELPRRLQAHEKDMIQAALKESHGRVDGPSGAATRLGIARSTLESKIRSLKIDKHRFKAANHS